ncbi:hypothetical protein SAMN04244560_02649 [Thermoanaerobacter thermohydrosulfuricus]|uniref:Uncharacterized protein n=1 Tax=Thermoanaerobacter thermohydrosulfuricus TaxID=1516 RepID=A0A1G7VPV9_THETY|nr:hypothetical protein [Thermoanaerobacter thermohydrosulfuricus]SDG61793.1 hypothetical protein SAMN04244560_02649 [Thermoanaerobacter thermohydrosulfuricus]
MLDNTIKVFDGVFKYIYNQEFDILDVFIKKVEPSYSEEIYDGVYVYRNRGTNDIIGFSIMDYSKRDKNVINKHLPIQLDFEYINSHLIGGKVKAETENEFLEDLKETITVIESGIVALYDQVSKKHDLINDKVDRKYDLINKKLETINDVLNDHVRIPINSVTNKLGIISNNIEKLSYEIKSMNNKIDKLININFASKNNGSDSILKSVFYLYVGVAAALGIIMLLSSIFHLK